MTEGERLAVCVRVRGRVQGVGFRWKTREAAVARGLAGWVCNHPDGSVEAWIEGERSSVGEMLDWLRVGPRSARVDALESVENAPQGLNGFQMR